MDYLVELHGAMQAVKIKNIPEFEKAKIIYDELEAEEFKHAENILNEAKAYNSLRNMWDDIDKTEQQIYKRIEILGLRK